MSNTRRSLHGRSGGFVALLAVFLFTGCHSASPPGRPAANPASPIMTAAGPVPADTPAPTMPSAPAATPAVAETAPPAAAAPTLPPVRIKAGRFSAFTDSDGNVWLPDQGFADGDTADRSDDLPIANTKDPAIYRTERYGMTAFSYPVPNGRYTVRLHFAETYSGITGPGGRVFSFDVGGQEFKDFDVWARAGGPQRAEVETVNVEVTNGKLDVTFTAGQEKPEINGIEILPAP